MTTMDDLAKRARANAHDLETTGTATVARDRAERNTRRRVMLVRKDTADAMAADTTAETPVFVVPAHMVDGIEVKTVTLVTRSAIAGDNTDTVIVSISKRDGAGGAATVLAQRSTDLNTADAFGNLGTAVTALVPTAFSVSTTLATRSLATGQILTFDVAKGGAGK